ncbi:MAG: hypothetical protein ACHQQS_03865 [Thermoanaerobaculales bacterium]
MTGILLLLRVRRTAVLTALLASAPARYVVAGGGNLEINLYADLKWRADAAIRFENRYVGVSNSQNLLWNYSEIDSSQSSCPALTPNAGLGTPLGGWGGNVYVPEYNVDKIWKVNPLTCAGLEYKPSYSFTGQFGAMDWGPDKKGWIVVNNYAPSQSAIIRFDPMTNTFEDPYPVSGTPIADLKKYNGNMYATNVGANELDQITPAWSVTRYKFNGPGYGTLGGWIASGCDGTLWFTYGYYITAMTTANKFYFFDSPGAGLLPLAIAQDAYRNAWVSYVGSSNALSVIDASSIPSDFSKATFYNYDTGDYQVGAFVPVRFPRVLSPLTRGRDYNSPQAFMCPSAIMGGVVFYGNNIGRLATYGGYDQSTCPLETGNRGLIITATPLLRGRITF